MNFFPSMYSTWENSVKNCKKVWHQWLHTVDLIYVVIFWLFNRISTASERVLEIFNVVIYSICVLFIEKIGPIGLSNFVRFPCENDFKNFDELLKAFNSKIKYLILRRKFAKENHKNFRPETHTYVGKLPHLKISCSSF